HPVLPVPAGDPQGGLHDQRDRIAEHGDAQVHPQPTHLPQRRIGTEGDVPGNPGGIEELEIDPSLEAGAAELPAHVRRGARPAGGVMKTAGNTVRLTDPGAFLCQRALALFWSVLAQSLRLVHRRCAWRYGEVCE